MKEAPAENLRYAMIYLKNNEENSNSMYNNNQKNLLDKNDMVMDFSDLKKLVMKIIDHWDHALFLNENDEEINNIKNCNLRKFKTDPTAEVLCQFLYDEMTYLLSNEIYEIDSDRATKIKVHSISIWESDTSKATYIEE